MAIAGSVNDDYKWFYPDKTGFMFDTPPMNVASGRGAYFFSVHGDERYYSSNYLYIPWNKVGGKYSDSTEHETLRYNGVLNWINKYEIDNRFLAISDKNANLYQFPEVQYPWKFTEYVFVGTGAGYEVVEPPLYDPATLTVVNGIKNPTGVDLLSPENEHLRKEGKLSGEGYEDIHYEPVYYYQCKFSADATDSQIKSNTRVLGPKRKQYEPNDELRLRDGDLESGLIVDGKIYPPWTEPLAHGKYRNTFIKTNELCGVRRVFKYMTSNRRAEVSYVESSNSAGARLEKTKKAGIRLYRKDIPAKCVDIGQHGNIPPFTINMSAPKDYINPETMYRNTVEAIVTYEAGQAMYATDDGLISFTDETKSYYNSSVYISKVNGFSYHYVCPSGKSGSEWKFKMYKPTGVGEPIAQPKPELMGSKFKERCYGTIPAEVSNGMLIHKGCPFFVKTTPNGEEFFSGGGIEGGSNSKSNSDSGSSSSSSNSGSGSGSSGGSNSGSGGGSNSGSGSSSSSASSSTDYGLFCCSIKRDLLESGKNPLTHPEEFQGIFGDEIRDENGVLLFSPGEDVGVETAAKCMSSGKNPEGCKCRMYAQSGPREVLVFMCDEMSNEEFANSIGFNQYVDTANDIAYSSMGLGVGGFLGGMMVLGATPSKIEQQTTSLNGMNIRKKVRYEYKEVNLNGKETTGYQTSVSDTRTVVPGSGKFAFDKYDTSCIGGVDTNFFNGTNLLSRSRFCSTIMPCYNAKYCNNVYGYLKLSDGEDDTTFAGVGPDNHYCRYYNGGCPTTNISRRAREYDREYKKLLNNVLSIFRINGIMGFDGLSEVPCGENSYAAVGNCKELYSIASVSGRDGNNVYFIYDKSKSDEKHTSSNVYAFITQYPQPEEGSSLPENSYYKMNRNKYPLMSILPSCFGSTTEIPWLVKLHDDYVSPTRAESYATNFKRFIGGRMPEYKDFTRMGEEIQCTVQEIQEGYDGDLTSGKGGKDEWNDYTTSTSYQYYRVDASGEWIIEPLSENGDGLSIGQDTEDGRKHGGARAALPPSKSKGATPIKGSYVNSSYSQQKGMIPAKMTLGWCFSNDNRYSLENDKAMVQDGDGEPVELPNAIPPDNCLPVERDWYYCPSCSPKPYSYYEAERHYDQNANINKNTGEFNINQIFTDFEYQHYDKCPRCNTKLKIGGKMKHFAKCRAQGIVNYFGLPGEIIDTNGYFWKNHTEVNRTLISEILSKNGSIIDGVYKMDDSANKETESAVVRPARDSKAPKGFGKGENYTKGYLSEASRNILLNDKTNTKALTANASTYALTNTKTPEQIYQPSFMRNNKRMDSPNSFYNDRYVSPYPLKYGDVSIGSNSNTEQFKNNGMEFVSANMLKNLRNMVMPWQAYPCYDNGAADSRTIKQTGWKNRFTEEEKNFDTRRKGLPSFILASNQAKSDLNYVQFWDGTLIPGKCVRAYYPTSPLWWYRHDSIGGISRDGGTEGIHFNDASGGFGGTCESGYGGNVTTMSFHSIQGWLPLDKEVVRAFLSVTLSWQPDCPPVGRTQKGGPMHDNHWHSFTSANFEDAMGVNHNDYDNKMLSEVMGWSEDLSVNGNSYDGKLSDGNYVPINYKGEQFVGGDDTISQYVDNDFGFNTSQNWIEWDGYGTDIVQTVTEESIWKKYTFDEFKEIENRYTYDVEYEVGDPTEEGSVKTSASYIPKQIADGLINNIGQGITNMFNLTGLNSSGIFNKNGMDIAEKKYDTEWATGGQIIVQEDDVSNTVLNRTAAALGKTLEIEVTDKIKYLYNNRISRDFSASLGLSYGSIWNWVKENKVDYKEPDGLFDKQVNYRHYNKDIGGYWLNSMAFYPELEEGKFPTIDSGMEYKIKPKDICDIDACGPLYLEPEPIGIGTPSDEKKDLTKNDPMYYKYSPHVLCFCDSDGRPDAGKFDEKFNVVDGDWSKCKIASSNINDMYFILNISGYPTQTSHRPYRNSPGSWNTANAICSNKECFVNIDGVRVSQAAVLSAANKVNYRNYGFSTYHNKCGACGTELTEADGAIYVGGDGLETWEYRDIPKPDCIINGFIIDVDNLTSKCGFDVYGMSSTDSFWEKLLTVDYDYDDNKYIWQEYEKTVLVKKSGASLPIFKGVWKDGYNAAKESLDGYHFLAKRCNKIKVVGRPCQRRTNGEYLPNNGRAADVIGPFEISPDNFVSGSRANFKVNMTNLSGCEGGVLEIYRDAFSDENRIFTSEIRSYNQSTRIAGLAKEIPKFITEDGNTYHYCIKTLKYIFTVKKFQVYGLEVCDNVTITDDAETVTIPVQTGVASVSFYDKASKILRVMAVNGNSLAYEMEDVGKDTPLTSNDLYYKARYDLQNGKYRIVSGQFFYDTLHNVIYLPYRIKNEDDGKVVEDVDNVYTSNLIFSNTIPTAINIKYMVNAGASVDLDITSLGEGPSYAVERDCITEIVTSNLPKIGESVFLRKENKRVELNWMVTNKERTIYEHCSEPYLTGLELAQGVTHSSFKDFLGGNDETDNGLNNEEDNRFLFSGKVKGKITLTGLPNCIVSGVLYVRAPAIRETSYTINGETVIARERTGGLRYTGFTFMPSLSVRGPDANGQSLTCIAGEKPKLVVYLKERDVTQDFTD